MLERLGTSILTLFDNDVSSTQGLFLTTEVELEYPVKYQEEDRLLTGRADYAFWYSYKKQNTHLIVVEVMVTVEPGYNERKTLITILTQG